MSTSKEIESVIENLPANKSAESYGFTGEFYQALIEEIIPVILKLFQKINEKGILPNSFYDTSITLTQTKTRLGHHRPLLQENYTPVSLMNIDAKVLNK